MSARIDEAQDFLRELWGDDLPLSTWLLVWSLRDRRSHWRQSVAEAAAVAAGLDGDVYHGVALHSIDHGPTKRGPADAVAFLPGLWLDVDWHDPVAHKAADLPPDSTAATKLLEESPLRPSLVVESGYGLQAYWLFPKPWDVRTCRKEAAALSVAWQTFLIDKAKRDHGWKVDATHDLARVLRLPGTLNHKGGEPRPVTVLRNSIERYDVDEFRGVLALNDLDENGGLIVEARGVTRMPRGRPKGAEHFQRITKGSVAEGERNTSLTSWIGKMLSGRTDLEDIDAVRFLLDSALLLNETRFKPPLPEEEVRRTFRSVLNREIGRRAGEELESVVAFNTAEVEAETPAPPDNWRLVIVGSNPTEYRLYHRLFDGSPKGFVELGAEEMTNGTRLRKAVLEQSQVLLTRGFCKAWDAREEPGKPCLAEMLVRSAERIHPSIENQRLWVVADRLQTELGHAKKWADNAKPGRLQPQTMEDGSIVFWFSQVFDALANYSSDKITRKELTNLLELLNAEEIRDHQTRFRRLTKEGLDALAKLVNDGPKAAAEA